MTGHAIAPGIYFGMDEAEYHAAPALSSSGIRNLLVSPLDYWINSHMNPEYADEKTPAMEIGTAFHRRLLEPERFAELYAPIPTKDDYPDAIDGGDALKAECERLGLKRSGRIADLCERILDAEPDAQLWPVIEKQLREQLAGKTLLKREVMADIERAASIVLAHPSAAKALSGGVSEVSIFWIDEETGVPLKARVDYLKTRAIIDVKSFTNPLGKPIDSAVASAVANGRYDVQAVMYDDAVANAKRMLRSMKSAAIHGTPPADDWLIQFASCPHHAFVFVFIEQGPVTNVRVREFRRTETYGGTGMTENAYWSSGRIGYRHGVKLYSRCMERFGPDKPWIDDQPMRAFSDTEFPMYLFNEVAA